MHRSAALLAGFTAATIVAAAPARAQYSYVYVDVNAAQCPGSATLAQGHGTVALQSQCTVTQPFDPSLSTAHPGPFWSGTGSVSNGAGILRAGLDTRIYGNDATRPYAQMDGSGRAQAWWTDQLTFGAGSIVPAFVDLTLSVHGLLAVSADPSLVDVATAGVQASFDGIGGGTQPVFDGIGTSLRASTGCPTCVAHDSLENTWLLNVHVPTVGSSTVTFNAMLVLTSGVSLTRGNTYVGTSSLYSIADFTNTAYLSRVQFFDALGQPVTQGVRYAFANGTLVQGTEPPPVPVPTTTPEPGTWLLLLTGLLGVGAAARRRAA